MLFRTIVIMSIVVGLAGFSVLQLAKTTSQIYKGAGMERTAGELEKRLEKQTLNTSQSSVEKTE